MEIQVIKLFGLMVEYMRKHLKWTFCVFKFDFNLFFRREWISPAATTFIIDTFSENWSEQPKDIQDIDWYFLPVMNPDGMLFSMYSMP